LLTYIFLKMGRSFRFAGMEHLWDVIVNRQQFVFRDLKYFPLAAGICLGFAQYVPEMIQKRIKLTLHLPMEEWRIITLMLVYGASLLLAVFVCHVGAVYVFASLYFPAEFIVSMLTTVLPWYMSGLIAYAFIAMLCLEPTWKRRIFIALVAAATIQGCYISDFPGAYTPVLLAAVCIPLFVLPFAFLSVYRFKQGKQD